MSEIEVFEVQCGECESDFQVDATQAGKTVHCPHCECLAEVPSLTELMSEDETTDVEVAPASRPAMPNVSSDATRKRSQKTQPFPKKRERLAEQSAKGSQDPATEARPKVKVATARSSVKLLLKMSGIFHYIACFVGVAWSIKIVGTLYPIVNSKRGSYMDWFIEATITTAWAAALMGLLIAVAELIKVIIHIHENMMTTKD